MFRTNIVGTDSQFISAAWLAGSGVIIHTAARIADWLLADQVWLRQHLPQPAPQPVQSLPPLPTAAWPAEQLADSLLCDADQGERLGDAVAETG
jgi:hypothetical protein